MNNIVKNMLGLYFLGAIGLISYLLCSSECFLNKVIGDRADSIAFSQSFYYNKENVEYNREVYSILRSFWGVHSMESTILDSKQGEIAYNRSFTIRFLNDYLFSIRMKKDNRIQIPSPVEELTKIHLNEYPREEFFQIIKKAPKLICYASLTTSEISCAKFVK
jgi:hypothetical protein